LLQRGAQFSDCDAIDWEMNRMSIPEAPGTVPAFIAKLGLEAVLTIDGVEITNGKDLTVNLEKAETDASTRANNGWRANLGTLKDASIEFAVLNNEGDTAFGLRQGLWSLNNLWRNW